MTGPPPTGRRRCAPRPRQEGELRPTDVVGGFFVFGIAFLAAAAVCAVVQASEPWAWGRWLALHLAFVGGVSQLVLGASQFFAGAFLSTDPPPRKLVRAQLVAWNAGAVLLAVAVPAREDLLVWAAVALLVAALAAWGAAILGMRGRSLRVSPWATRWYTTSAAFFAAGMLAGSLLANATLWPHGSLLGAHMVLNLGGWFGGAIVGTLHTFYPSLTQTQLRFPRLQGVAYAAWTAGVAALAAGYAWTLEAAALAGWAGLCLAGLALLANVAASALAAPRPLSLAARVVGTAQPFLLAGVLFAAGASLADGYLYAIGGSTRTVLGTLLVAGWIGLTVLGSLFHLLAVVLRVRGGFATRMPTPRPRLDLPLAALAAAAVAVLALSQGGVADLEAPARVALIAAYAILGARVASLAGRVVLKARPSL